MEPDGQFANPDSVATPQWLEAHLDDSSVVIVDTRYSVGIDDHGAMRAAAGRDAYEVSHVPGAVFLNLDDLRDPDEPRHILDPTAFAEIMGRLGITDAHEVVVYDAEGGTWGARLWWALRYHGHESVRILDGGFTNWVQLGLPTTAGDVERESSHFMSVLRPELRVGMSDVLTAIDETGVTIVDALPEPFFTGQVALYPHLRRGHISGARNVPALSNVDPKTWTLRPPSELRATWEPIVAGADRIVTYCGAGVYAAFDLFVLHLLGHDAALYDGSWEEWGAAEDTPVETGPDTTGSEER